MKQETSFQKLRRIRPIATANLDEILSEFDSRSNRQSGKMIATDQKIIDKSVFLTSQGSRPVFGCRLWEHSIPEVLLASKLATFAHEHTADIVVVSCDESQNLEKYGFRVEKVSSVQTERDQQVEELRAFWGITLFV